MGINNISSKLLEPTIAALNKIREKEEKDKIETIR